MNFFAMLAIIAIAHDIYLWVTSDGYPFAFAALGWISKTYLPDIHQAAVDMIGPEIFNQILTPVLKIPAFFLMASLALTAGGIGLILRLKTAPPKNRPRPKIK